MQHWFESKQLLSLVLLKCFVSELSVFKKNIYGALKTNYKKAIKKIVTNSSKKISFLRLIFMNFFSFSFQSSRLSSLSIWSRHKLEVGKETWDRELLEAQS